METQPARLGELLIKAGLLRQQDLDEALRIAKEGGQLIGKVLLTSGFVTKTALHLAIEAQSLIRDKMVDYDLAILALSRADTRKSTLEAALLDLGWRPDPLLASAKLGQLLVEAGVINPGQLNSALELARKNGAPLGGILKAMKAIDDKILLLALEQQTGIRNGTIARAAAIRKIVEVSFDKSRS